jgi:hypothetical protein
MNFQSAQGITFFHCRLAPRRRPKSSRNMLTGR